MFGPFSFTMAFSTTINVPSQQEEILKHPNCTVVDLPIYSLTMYMFMSSLYFIHRCPLPSALFPCLAFCYFSILPTTCCSHCPMVYKHVEFNSIEKTRFSMHPIFSSILPNHMFYSFLSYWSEHLNIPHCHNRSWINSITRTNKHLQVISALPSFLIHGTTI